MKRILKTEAFVLRKRSLPNEDKIITLFTEEIGKVQVFAKGIKKITSKRLPHVQTSNFIHAVLYRKNDHMYLQDTSLISGFQEIKKDPEKVELLYAYLFILDRLLPEHQNEHLVYREIKKFLIELSKLSSSNRRFLEKYMNKTLMLLGYTDEKKEFEELQRIIEDLIDERMPHIS